jgi:hypothetical protein
MINTHDYYELVESIDNSKSIEYKLLLRSMLGNCAFLVDNVLPIEHRIYSYLNRSIININNIFSSIEDKITIKWRYNERMIKNYFMNIMYIKDDNLNIGYILFHKRCMPDIEYDMIRELFKKENYDDSYLINVIKNIFYYAESCIIKQAFFNLPYKDYFGHVNSNHFDKKYVHPDDINKCDRRIKELKRIAPQLYVR